MAVFVCGDTHIPYDYQKLNVHSWNHQRNLDKEDYLIIAGDFGLLWDHKENREEKWYRNNLVERKFTTLFIDGNHENFARLNALPEIDMFGGKVGEYCEGIYHLKRGYVYTIPDKYGIEERTIFTFGGAMSTDKEHRIVDVSWWADEIPTKAEEDFALDNLEAHRFKVDHVITHAAPQTIVNMIGYKDRYNDPVARFLEFLLINKLEFRNWHFGHYHEDRVFHNKFYCHYNKEPFKLY